MTVEAFLMKIKQKISGRDMAVFLSAFAAGLCAHLRIFVSDIPNHDGLSGIYFDQNMITSGRWFLTVACHISTDYTLPWVIGLLSLLYLGLTAVALCRFFGLKHTYSGVLIAALLAVYPSLSSNFAYIFTADGYMLALLLAVLSVCLVERSSKGFLWGGILLGFSMGIYQAYLAFAMVLAVYGACRAWFFKRNVKENWLLTLRYAGMGVLGAAVYYGMLQICLKIQNTELSGYQGIGSENTHSFVSILANVYRDFITHTLRGNIMVQKGLLLAAAAVLFLAAALVLAAAFVRAGSHRNVWSLLCLVAAAAILPVCFNVMLVISPDVTYHSLMRYQWVLMPVCAVAVIDRLGEEFPIKKVASALPWAGVISALVVVFSYILICNVAYFNLEKKFSKTYSYCLRLLDRIEQMEGYTYDMPIAMIGVVSDEAFPSTDLTVGVTDSLLGTSGDYLVYTAQNYKDFWEYYFGVTVQLVDSGDMTEIYESEEYRALDPFPAQNCMVIVDGVLYVKTENKE
ncbi:MAG: glucosyltransferase domain-containing protein [Lachnospiraceae bacterium]|nr:glucosyltransferase domain-containing protein [Lachnospiraceae bacterium]